MSSVDDRVVNMKFNNSSFNRGVSSTVSSLDKLKKSLDFSQSTKSMNDLEGAASRFHMGNMGASIEGISKKFLALGTVGVTAIANITNRAINAGVTMVKALTVTPIAAGLENYETKINAIQTILANTKTAGVKLKDVTGVLAELNEYANKTIYNFSEMTRNIGTFTAAGVDLKTATSSIKGIANLAALSGSNSQQASTAMYQLSQAISAGQVHLQDWNSVVNAGMGGTVFQRALAQTAVAMGTLKDSQVKLSGSMKNVTVDGNAFRQSLTPPPGGTSWLTSKVLTTALSTFTGDLKAGQLAAQGFTKEQIKAIQAQAKTAVKAATQIKTISQLHQALKEEVASSWSNVWETLLGDFHEAPKLLTPLHNTLQNMFQRPADDLNKLLKSWSAFGGRNVAILGIKQLFEDIGRVIQPIKDAYRQIFPKESGRDLYNLTVSFANFVQKIRISDSTMKELADTFTGVFSVFHIIGAVVKGVFGVFKDLFGLFASGSGSILSFTSNIGAWLYSLDQALTKGGALEDFFTGLEDSLRQPVQALKTVKDYILTLFAGFHPGGADKVAGTISGIGAGLTGFANIVEGAWDRVNQAFDSAREHLRPVTKAIGNFFTGLHDSLSNAFGGHAFNGILHSFNTVFLGGIAVAISRFLKGGLKIDVGSGFLSNLSGALEGLTGKLEAMQMELKAKALMEVGVAIALLTASVVAVSLIKPKKLEQGVKGIGLLMIELLGAMKTLTTISAGSVKLPLLAASLVIMAGAIDLLVLAVLGLSRLSWDQLKKGLTGVGVLLGELSVAVNLMSKSNAGMIRTGVGITALAVGLNILARAVKYFGNLDWKVLGKGLTGIAGVLAVIAGAMHLMPAQGMVAQSIAITIIAGALLLLQKAIVSFAKLDWHVIGHGLTGIAGALGVIAGAMHLMPERTMVGQAIALTILSVALKGIAGAVAKMGAIDFKVMVKGLVGIGGALAILAVALNHMSGTARASISLGIAAAALAVLEPTLERMGKLPISQIAKGLLVMAGVFGVIGGAGLLLSDAVGPITALSFALIAFGAAVALIGGGVYLLGKGFGYLADHGSKGVATLLKALDGIIERLPEIAKGLAKGLVNFVYIIGKNAPKIIGALGKILKSLGEAIIKDLPTLLELFTKLIHTLIQAIDKNAGDIIDAAFRLIETFLNGLAKKLPDIVKAAADVVVNFLKGLADNIGRIVDAGFKFVVSFLNGIADAIDKHEEDILKAAGRIGEAIVTGLWKGMGDLLQWVWGKVSGFFGWLWDKILGFFGIHSPSTLAAGVGKAIVQGIWSGISGLGSWVWGKVSNFFGDLWDKIVHIFDNVASFGKKIVQNLWSGISGAAGWIMDKVTGFLGNLFDKIAELPGKIAGLGSKLFSAGKNIMGSLFDGIWDALQGAGQFAMDLGRSIVDGLISAINGLLDLPLQIPQITIPIPFAPDIHFGPYTILPQIPGLATGGLVKKKGMALVGEEGAEVVELPAGSKVYPNGTGPSITPVLDLDQLRKDAEEIKKILSVKPEIQAEVSFRLAKNISDSIFASRLAIDDHAQEVVKNIKFEQTNVSPKALSPSEIYRNTNNQLRFAAEVLT